MECQTNATEIAAGTKLSIKDDSSASNCTTCIYEQLNTSTFPAITSVAKPSATNLVFTGTNFYETDFDVTASILGIKADSIESKTATEITAKWNMGIPASATS